MTVVELLAPPATAPQRCAVCGSAVLEPHLRVTRGLGDQGLVPTTDAFGTALDDIVRCVGCGHRQVAHLPSDARLLSLYHDAWSDDYVREEAGQRVTARATLDLLERHVAPGRLLDIGCWVGFLLAEARERGWEVVGVEPSRVAAAYARDALGLPVHEGELLTADLPEGTFDAVVLGDVIEHLPDPAGALERITRLLRPGGVVHLTLPDAGSALARRMGRRWWSVIPTHVQHFTRASVCALLRRAGFEPLAVTTAPKTFSVRYYLARLGGYSPALARALVAAATRAGVANRLWTPDFRDRMAVVARRPASRLQRDLPDSGRSVIS
jgi:SAM-dependent methyltransferase